MNGNDEAFPDLTEDDIETIVRRIEKTANAYNMTDVLEEYVGWGDRERLLWHLTRTEALATEDFPHLWSNLREGYGAHGRPEDVVELLTRIESYDSHRPDVEQPYGSGTGVSYEPIRLIDDWPLELDRLACKAYDEAPELFDERWDEFNDEIQKGLTLVQRRFGDIEIDEMPEGVLRDLAETHVRDHGLPAQLYLVENGELRNKQIFNKFSEYTSALDDFVTQFGSREAWEKTVLEIALDVESRLQLQESRDGWRRATRDELVELMSKVPTAGGPIEGLYELLLEVREDEPGDLIEVARELHDQEASWASEIALVSAVLKLERVGEPVPEDIVELWTLETIGSASDRHSYEGLDYLTRALAYVPEDRTVEHIEDLFIQEGPLTPSPHLDCCLVLQVWPDRDELFDAAFEAAEQRVGNSTNFNTMGAFAHGMALVGPDALPRLVEEMETTDHSLLHDACQRAIVYVLADMAEADEPLPSEYDEYISFADWRDEDTNGYSFVQHLKDDLVTAFEALPEARAESILLEQLDAEHNYWPRALFAVQFHPTDALVDRAFELVETEGVPPDEEHRNWFEEMLKGLGESAVPKIADALADSHDAELHNAVEEVLGASRYESVLDEIDAESMADQSRADKIERLCREWLEEHSDADTTTIHLFERLDEAPESGAFSRVGGTPLGVDLETWPYKNDDDDLPMKHVFTLDLEDAPSLDVGFADDVRAVALFIHNPRSNQAMTPGNDDAEVLPLTQEELEQRYVEGELPAGSAGPGRAVEARGIEVPSIIFRRSSSEWYDAEPGPLKTAREEIFQAGARSGGSPIWLQSEQFVGGFFLMQFDESFCPGVNMGDVGVTYVYNGTAFWQCH